MARAARTTVERHTIDVIPDGERHGRTLVVGLAVGGDDPVAAQSQLPGSPLAQIALWSLAAVTMLTNSMNLYGATLCVVTAVQTSAHRRLPGPTVHALLSPALCAARRRLRRAAARTAPGATPAAPPYTAAP
ncbi:hypothetical protein [Streptomyces sp. NPDC053560]|uniref:hypothetical protein n=1 Tax=Streptomyces sp. NPDC053560 TaxID=3365711 RepID=UPI0037D7BD36